ncbi:zinc ABC transporter permease [Vibrio metschnikovii]|nr:zinc ABC transporter permease [Vibrio metschnikovii]
MSAYGWMLAPLLIGFISLWINWILGRQVLERGVIFIDLAMAQMAAVGMLAMELWWPQYSSSLWWKMLAASLVTFSMAGLLCFFEGRIKTHLEAFIGLFYVLAACAAMLLVAQQPHGKESIESLLNGRLLWSQWQDVIPVLVIALAMLIVVRYRSCWLQGKAFYFLFAVAIPPLVINLGVYLEFASLIIPALAVCYLPWQRKTAIGLAIGYIAMIAGFAASLYWDWPIGPAVVFAMMWCAVVMVFGAQARALLQQDSAFNP